MTEKNSVHVILDAQRVVEALRDAPVPWSIHTATAAVNTIVSLIDELKGGLGTEVFEEVAYVWNEVVSSTALVHIDGDRAVGQDKFHPILVELQHINGQWVLADKEEL